MNSGSNPFQAPSRAHGSVGPEAFSPTDTIPADTIRLATASDAGRVANLIEYATFATAFTADERDDARALLAAGLASQEQAIRQGGCYVAECGDEVIGVCAWARGADAYRLVLPRTARGSDRCRPAASGHVRALAVHPAYPRLTLSRLMLILAEASALRQGVDSIEAFATHADRWVYLACGFRSVEPQRLWCPGDVIGPGLRVRRRLSVLRPVARRNVKPAASGHSGRLAGLL